MANTLRIKRRAAGGAAGAPASLANAELAFNEQDNTLYYGWGTGGVGGTATQAIAIGGPGAFQAVDADLTAIAALSTTGLAVRTAANTWALRSITAPAAGITITNGDGVLGNPTLALANDLAALEGLSTTGLITRTADGAATTRTIVGTTNNIVVSNGNGVSGNPTIDLAAVSTVSGSVASTTSVLQDLTTDGYGRVSSYSSINLSDVSLDQFKVPQANLSINSKRLTNVADPVNPQDAATKAYVDAARAGLDVKDSCRVATTGSVGSTSNTTTIGGTPNTLDGVSLVVGNRVLVKNQTTASENGLYEVTVVGTGSNGTWTRAGDGSGSYFNSGAFIFIEEGTANAGTGWVLTTPNPIVMPQALTFAQFSGAGAYTAGAGMTQTGTTFNVGGTTNRITVNADSIDLAMAGTAGTYKSVTTDAYGRVTAGTNPTTLAGYGITDAQPLDATLTALTGVITAADKLIYATALDTFTTATLTAFGRSLIDDADAGTARTTLGLGTMSTQASTNVSITGGSIDGITFDGGTF